PAPRASDLPIVHWWTFATERHHTQDSPGPGRTSKCCPPTRSPGTESSLIRGSRKDSPGRTGFARTFARTPTVTELRQPESDQTHPTRPPARGGPRYRNASGGGLRNPGWGGDNGHVRVC